MKECEHELYSVMYQASTATAKNTHIKIPGVKYCAKCRTLGIVKLEPIHGFVTKEGNMT